VSAVYWRNGSPTEAGHAAFTEGDCWILALVLYEMTGFEIYTLDSNVHWVVRVGYNTYLDVGGISTRAELLDLWECSDLRRVGDTKIWLAERDRLRVAETFAGSWRRAPVMARRLLDKYGLT
jgi:hypothetical protein